MDHSLSLTHSLSHAHSPTPSHSLTPLTHSHSLTHSLTLTRSLSLTHTHHTHITHSQSHSLTCACRYIHTHKLTHHHPSITLILPLPLLLFYAQSKSREVDNIWGYPVLYIFFFKIELGGHFGSHLPANCSGNHLLRQPLASHLAASCCKLERKVKSTKSLVFSRWHLAATCSSSHVPSIWQPFAANLKKSKIYKITFFQDGTRQPLGSHFAATCSVSHLGATCFVSHLATTWQSLHKHLASGCQVADRASGCQVVAKWLTEQVAASGKSK